MSNVPTPMEISNTAARATVQGSSKPAGPQTVPRNVTRNVRRDPTEFRDKGLSRADIKVLCHTYSQSHRVDVRDAEVPSRILHEDVNLVSILKVAGRTGIEEQYVQIAEYVLATDPSGRPHRCRADQIKLTAYN